jgi:NAD(P)-dependent dehydrogenase (short-subunit alcohol dehydrogenase family)
MCSVTICANPQGQGRDGKETHFGNRRGLTHRRGSRHRHGHGRSPRHRRPTDFPQLTALRNRCRSIEIPHLHVVKPDITDPVDIQAVMKLDFDVLLNHAGIGEGGPVSKIPLDLVRKNFETNIFAPLALTQKVARKWIDWGRDLTGTT